MKARLLYSTLAVSLALCLLTCKKKENGSLPSGPHSGYNGIFLSSINRVVDGASDTAYFTMEEALISSKPLNHSPIDIKSLVDVGSVSLDGVPFERSIPANYYTDSSHSNPFTPPHIWSITGSTLIPAFTFTNTNAYPTFEGYKNLPDTFYSSTGPVIPLTNHSDVDEIEAHFITTLGKMTDKKYFPGNTDTLRFSVSELAPVGPYNFVTLYLTLYKNNKQVINGNSYVFQTGYSVRKQGIRYN